LPYRSGEHEVARTHRDTGQRHSDGKEIEVMKKVVLFALLFAAVAGAAQAYVNPKCGVAYHCSYTNYPDPIVNGGISIFDQCVWVNPGFVRGTEEFQTPYGWDNRKFSFAKPVNGYDAYGLPMTTWEFTINPYGPQCKTTKVMFGGDRIEFKDCTDGHSRVCTTW
jgi:hypothetical protein